MLEKEVWAGLHSPGCSKQVQSFDLLPPSTQLLITYLVICEHAWKMDYPLQLLAAMAQPSPVPL